MSKDEIAAFSVHAGVAQERRTTMISQMIETTSRITLESTPNLVQASSDNV